MNPFLALTAYTDNCYQVLPVPETSKKNYFMAPEKSKERLISYSTSTYVPDPGSYLRCDVRSWIVKGRAAVAEARVSYENSAWLPEMTLDIRDKDFFEGSHEAQVALFIHSCKYLTYLKKNTRL
ncbi:uncharacterized protein H6S33_007570 [Morchella sextelata]|uniref:uncharacterized protein n=1 Tax=Morchella sextelata TaxID=1174677 RepID=UPI001D04C8CB|nr:uncharacterized protein H6S33_007570 [Morchella sextelata]KAH0603911.1 hypothetical protein H6S33_007570 [Morchella sextelata]